MRELEVAIDAAIAAAERTRREFARPTGIKAKSALDFVTATDEAVEILITQRIESAFPGHRILGEESAKPPWQLDDGTIWVLDPVCGTESFAFGLPLFCTNILLLRDGEPVLAVVAEGLRDEIVYAVRGQGAFALRATGSQSRLDMPGTPLRGLVTGTTMVNYDCGLARTEHRMHYPAAVVSELTRRNVYSVRELGTSATLPMQVRGVLAGNIFDAACPWDLGAGAFLCQEAGHHVSAHDGSPWRPDGSPIVSGRDAGTHAELLDCLRVATESIRAA
jgi:myo-inositol-1(or 4)-monophosphatase